jgi:hypothetical protein
MKPPKPIVTKSIAGLLMSSVLAASCAPGYNIDDNIYVSLAENQALGKGMLDIIESGLADDVIHRSQQIASIIEDIYNNRDLARQFAENPNGFMATRSSDLGEGITLSESERAFLLAFSDDEIMSAAKAGNASLFIKLASEKGYLSMAQTQSSSLEDIRPLFENEESYNEFVKKLKSHPNYEDLIDSAVFVVFGPIFYIAAAVTIYVLAETLVFVQVGLVFHLGVATETNAERVHEQQKSIDPVIRLYLDYENNYYHIDSLYEELIVKQADAIVGIISESTKTNINTNIEATTTEQINLTKKLVTANLEGYYGFRK